MILLPLATTTTVAGKRGRRVKLEVKMLRNGCLNGRRGVSLMHGYEFHCSFVCVCAFCGHSLDMSPGFVGHSEWQCASGCHLVMWSAGQGELVESKLHERRPGTKASWSNGLLRVLIVIR